MRSLDNARDAALRSDHIDLRVGDEAGRPFGATAFRKVSLPLLAQLTAETIVVIHFGFVIFVVLGGFIAWRWHRVVWAHAPVALYGALIEFIGWTCPLTPLENHFWRLAGESGHEGGFIEHYLIPILYPGDYTMGLRVTLGLLVIALNIVAYGVIFRPRLRLAGNRPLDARS